MWLFPFVFLFGSWQDRSVEVDLHMALEFCPVLHSAQLQQTPLGKMVHGHLCFFYPVDCSFFLHDGVDGTYQLTQKPLPGRSSSRRGFVSLEECIGSSAHLNFQVRDPRFASISFGPVHTQRRKLGASSHGLWVWFRAGISSRFFTSGSNYSCSSGTSPSPAG